MPESRPGERFAKLYKLYAFKDDFVHIVAPTLIVTNKSMVVTDGLDITLAVTAINQKEKKKEFRFFPGNFKASR
jgi:hypothetical protein